MCRGGEMRCVGWNGFGGMPRGKGRDGGTEISWREISPDLRSGGMLWDLSIGN